MVTLLCLCLLLAALLILNCVGVMILLARQVVMLEASIAEAKRRRPDDRELFARVDNLGLMPFRPN